MNQQTASIAEIRVSVLVLVMALLLAVAFLAVVNVQTFVPLPDVKTPVGMMIAGLPGLQ